MDEANGQTDHKCHEKIGKYRSEWVRGVGGGCLILMVPTDASFYFYLPLSFSILSPALYYFLVDEATQRRWDKKIFARLKDKWIIDAEASSFSYTQWTLLFVLTFYRWHYNDSSTLSSSFYPYIIFSSSISSSSANNDVTLFSNKTLFT